MNDSCGNNFIQLWNDEQERSRPEWDQLGESKQFIGFNSEKNQQDLQAAAWEQRIGACSSCSSCSRVSIVISREKLQRKGQQQTPEIVAENHEYTERQGLLAPTHSHQDWLVALIKIILKRKGMQSWRVNVSGSRTDSVQGVQHCLTWLFLHCNTHAEA